MSTDYLIRVTLFKHITSRVWRAEPQAERPSEHSERHDPLVMCLNVYVYGHNCPIPQNIFFKTDSFFAYSFDDL
jgi:hypothetical protein